MRLCPRHRQLIIRSLHPYQLLVQLVIVGNFRIIFPYNIIEHLWLVVVVVLVEHFIKLCALTFSLLIFTAVITKAYLDKMYALRELDKTLFDL